MGIMVENQEIIDRLTKLADRMGMTKAAVLKAALLAEQSRLGLDDPNLFPRDRVEHRTITLR